MLKPIEQIDTSIKKDIIINNIMKSKGVYLLVSNPKVGKSMLALQLSCSVINGTPFLGHKVNPALVGGVCGEHGGDPDSVKFCHKIGLNYVSCSPFRIPQAKLAAAQAVVEGK